MKLDASRRHSGECFFEVNSIITGIPLPWTSELDICTAAKWDSPNQTEALEESHVRRDQLVHDLKQLQSDIS